MSNFMVWDADDFGVNHVISEMCQSHDCRDKLDQFHYANPNFKATLFAIPAEMTYELAEWCKANNSWIQLAVHGILHSSNYECSDMSKEDFDTIIYDFSGMIDEYFVKGFKAPGWQISDGIYNWLLENDWWVADQAYNNDRRPKELAAYVHDNGTFYVDLGPDFDNISIHNGKHHHTWDCVNNGVYECADEILDYIKGVDSFKFVSEVING